MIDFRRLTPQDRAAYLALLESGREPGCEYSFANLNLWGRQRIAFLDGFALIFSQFDRRSLYTYPLGQGDLKAVLDAMIQDAHDRGLPFRISGMSAAECAQLEALYPGRFHFHSDRDGFDYVYAIADLAELKGKRYQSKRNFANRFRAGHPDCQILPLDERTLPLVREMLEIWFAQKKELDPHADFVLETLALGRALSRLAELKLEGLCLIEAGKCLAMTLGSPLTENTFDIHFEKALDGVDGAYAFINQSFAQHLREKYPNLQYLNREDDLGIPGLRKAKLSYHPHHLVEKHWARLWEDDDAN